MTLLPDREPATATAWLERHQEITVVARDRGGGYGEAVTRALPQATQVADRWHLMENGSRAFLDAVRKTMRQIRAAIGATTINPELLTAAERLQYEGYQRREEVNAAILALAKDNVPIKEIVRRLGHSRQLVRRVIRGERQDIFRTRQSSLERHLPWLDAQWSSGCRNGADLWRRLKGQGFRGSLRVVAEWATRRRRAERTDVENLQRIPSSRTIARLMTIGRNNLSKAETVTITAIETGVPRLGSREDRRIPSYGPQQGRCRLGKVDRRQELGSFIRKRSRQRRTCCSRRHHAAVVQRADRRPDHETQTGQAADVRAGGSCPREWCSSWWLTAFAGIGRAGQLAIAGRLTAGSLLNGAMVSRVM